MITPDQLDRLKIESKLSESFCMATDTNGNRWVVFGNHVVDLATFNAMMLWYFANHTSYMRLIPTRTDYQETLRSLNPNIKRDNYHFLNELYQKFVAIAKTRSKLELIERFKECTTGLN